ncbi:MAG TPA: hypothetical protein VFF68_12025 [Anaerolineaceae bacterium]|nr:hypothetical protein [Anaerolineaceae bacterium]
MQNRFHRLNPPENGVPPEQVRFLELRPEPWPDGRRVRIHVQITPFLQPPHMSMSIADPDGREVSHVEVVENVDFKLVFTMHIRSEQVSGQYDLVAQLFYDDLGEVDRQTVSFETEEKQ